MSMTKYERIKRDIDKAVRRANWHYKQAMADRDLSVRLQAQLGELTIAEAEAKEQEIICE